MEKSQKQKKFFHMRPLFYGFLALLLSISTAKFLFTGELEFIILDVVICVVFLIYVLFTKKFVSLAIVMCFFALGLGLFQIGVSTFTGKKFVGTQQVVGRISDDLSASTYGDSVTATLKDVVIDGKNEGNIRLKINISNIKDVEAGDIISFETHVQTAKLFELGEFQNFYYRDKTPYMAEISSKDILLHGNSLNADEAFRLKVKDVLYQNMGSSNGALAFAALFGDRSDIDSQTYQNFKSAGIIHILAVSGLHISFLFALLGWILRKLHINRYINLLICGGVLGIYAWLCGFTPSILRAGIMGIILFFTKLSGKNYDQLSSLGAAGILILLFSPLSAYDLGFLLSFSCVLSIFMLSPILTKLFGYIFPKSVASAFAISFAVQLGVLPFMARMLTILNFLSAFVNLLVIPIFSVVYPILFIVAPIVAFLPVFGFLLKPPEWGFVAIKNIAEFFGQTQLKITLKPLDIFFVALFFVLLFMVSGFFMAKLRTKAMCCSCLFVLSCILFGCSYIEIPRKNTLAYCYNYSQSVVVLTDSQGDSLAIDLGYLDFSTRLLDRLGLSKVSTLLVLQDNSVNIDIARGLGVETIVRTGSAEGFDEEVVVQYNQEVTFGDFVFKYVLSGSRLVGISIWLKDVSIFVLKDWNIPEKALQSLAESEYDFVVLGKHDQYASYFSPETTILTYAENPFADSCFVCDGNVCYTLSEGHKWRCLD